MIRTQQREAAVVKQSQEIIQRSVGETWSPIKRNIEATKLWFTTFLAGGFSIEKANTAIGKLGDTLDKNRQRIYSSIEAIGKMGQQSIFTQLFGMEDYDASKIDTVVNSVTDVAKVKEYLIAQSKTLPKDIFGGKTMFEAGQVELTQWINALKGAASDTDSWMRHIKGSVYIDPSILSNMQIVADRITGTFEDIDDIKLSDNLHTAQEQFEGIFESISDSAEGVQIVMSDNVDSFNSFWSTLDTAREHVFNFKTNILELQNAILGLKTEVTDTFTDLMGQEHAGTLGMEIDVKSFDTAMDRMGRFSTMIKEYGSDWENMFYEVFDGKTYSMGDEEISYIDEYDSELKNAVNTVQDFSAAQKEVKKVMHEVNKAIMKNNLAIAELQLKGMMRRRGATRAEERAIKKFQIENMKERLKEKRASIEAMSTVDKQAYEDAQSDIKKYFDSQKFHLYLMKDAREDELAHMEETFDRKEGLLKHYQEALGIQEGHLEKAHQIELDFLLYISESLPSIATLYEDIYGVSIPASYQKAIDAHLEWLAVQGKTSTGAKKKATPITDALITPISTFLDDIIAIRKGEPVASRGGIPGWKRSFSRGIDYMPRTEPALIHQGERIVPAGKDVGGGNTIIKNVTIEVQQIADIGSVEKVGAILGAVNQTGIAGRTGKTKYRLR